MNKKNVETIYPLTPSQQGMLLETLADAESGRYLEQSVWQLTGELNVAAFAEAWQQVVARHAILRTCFVWKHQAEPLQVVLRQASAPMVREDWQACAADQQQARLTEYLHADRRSQFNLARAPLLRLALVQTAPQSYQFIWTFHHILLDGWCVPLIAKEILAAYDALQQGQPVIAAPGQPYGNYIAWLKRQDLAQAEAFWRQTLQGFTKPTPLGRTAPGSAGFWPASGRPDGGDPGYGEQKVRLPATATAALQALALQQRLTLSSVLQGVWAVLLSRYSGSNDVVFGATVSGRPSDLAGVETMIGFFINTVPVRLRIAPETSFWAWLKEMQPPQLAQRAYEYCSAGQIQQWSGFPGATPLYESILVFENYPVDFAALKAGGIAINIGGSQFIGAQTKYALTLLAAPGAELTFQLIYDRRRFDEHRIMRFFEHLTALLQAILATPAQPLTALQEIIPLEDIPRLSVLPPQGQRPAPEQVAPPATPTEIRLAALWTEILGIAAVSRHDNFFESGGHSLLATQLNSRINTDFRIELSLHDLFAHPTLAECASLIETIYEAARDQQAAQRTTTTAEEEEGKI